MDAKLLSVRTSYSSGGWATEYSYQSRLAANTVRLVLSKQEAIATEEFHDGARVQYARMWEYGIVEIIFSWGQETTERRWYYHQNVSKKNFRSIAKQLIKEVKVERHKETELVSATKYWLNHEPGATSIIKGIPIRDRKKTVLD